MSQRTKEKVSLIFTFFYDTMNRFLRKEILKMKPTFIYNPPAQDTVVRPLAEAVCLARGGQAVLYFYRGQEGYVTLNEQLASRVGMLRRADNGEEVNPRQVAQIAQNQPIQIRVDVNDVHVIISARTTVEQAMKQFKRKLDYHFKRAVEARTALRQRQRS